MTDDPWAEFRLPAPASSAPVEEDPWAEFRLSKTNDVGAAEADPMGGYAARFGVGAAQPVVGLGQLWARGGAKAFDNILGEGNMLSRGGRKIATQIMDPMAEKFADWARQGRAAAGLPEQSELLSPSTWDVPATLGDILSPVNLAGGRAAAGGLRAIGAGRLAEAGIGSRLTHGAGYGAAYGATKPVTSAETEGGQKTYGEAKTDQLLEGAIGGAIAGPLVGAAGDVIGPHLSDAVRYLLDRGVRLSPGQTSQGWFNRIEQGMESIPGAGIKVAEARHTGYPDFVRAAHDETLQNLRPVGGGPGQRLPDDVTPGYDAMRHTRRTISDFYDNVHATMTTRATPQMTADFHRIFQEATSDLDRPGIQKLQDIVNKNITQKFADRNGVLTGAELQAALAKIKQKTSDYLEGTSEEKAIARHLISIRRAVDNLRRSQNPAEAEALRGADRAYAMSKILQKAHKVNAGQAFDGQFSPAQLGKAMGDETGLVAGSEGRGLFQDLVAAGKQVLPNTLPNSGTAERRLIHELAIGLGGGAALGHAAHMAGGIAGTAALYSQPVQRLIRTLITGGRNVRGPLGDLVREYGPNVAIPLIANALMQSQQAEEGAY